MMPKIRKGYFISLILLLIGILLWSDCSFFLIGLSMISLGIVLLKEINDPNNFKK